MIVCLDVAGQPSKAIYFDNEGHTINYAITIFEKSIIFTSNQGPAMPVYRLTNESLENDNISVKFEMSHDGESIQTYTVGKCTKKKWFII